MFVEWWRFLLHDAAWPGASSRPRALLVAWAVRVYGCSEPLEKGLSLEAGKGMVGREDFSVRIPAYLFRACDFRQ